MSLTKRELTLLILLLALGITYVYYQYLYRAVEERISILMSENKNLEQNILIQEASYCEQRDILSSSAVLRENYQQLLWRVPEKPCLPEIIDYLSTASVQNSVQITRFDYKYAKDDEMRERTNGQVQLAPTSPETDYDLLQLELEAEGEYDNLICFALQIENAPRLFQFSSMSIEPKSDDETVIVEEKQSANAPPGAEAESLTTGEKSQVSQPEPDLQPTASSAAIERGETLRLLLKFAAFFDQASAGGLSAEDLGLFQEQSENASTE